MNIDIKIRSNCLEDESQKQLISRDQMTTRKTQKRFSSFSLCFCTRIAVVDGDLFLRCALKMK